MKVFREKYQPEKALLLTRLRSRNYLQNDLGQNEGRSERQGEASIFPQNGSGTVFCFETQKTWQLEWKKTNTAPQVKKMAQNDYGQNNFFAQPLQRIILSIIILLNKLPMKRLRMVGLGTLNGKKFGCKGLGFFLGCARNKRPSAADAKP